MKIKKILLICLLFVTVTLSGCEKKKGKNQESTPSNEIVDSISFSQLKEMAMRPLSYEYDEYKIEGRALSNTGSSPKLVECMGTTLYSYYDDYDGKYVLKNFVTNAIIDDEICNKYLGSYYSFYKYNYVYASSGLPIIYYCSYDSNYGTYNLKCADCYGNQLRFKTISYTDNLYDYYLKHVGDYVYFYVNFSSGSIDYFRYKVSNNKYVVECISESEYSNPTVSHTSNTNVKYNDGLTPRYDKSGNIVAYLYDNDNTLFIYDANKKYLNNINLTSFGFQLGYYNNVLELENKMYLFQNEEYYESELEVGSKPTYKCKSLEIDLTNGQVKYDDNFNYYIKSCYSKENDKTFGYAYVKYYDLNEKGEIVDLLKCAFVKNDLDFSNSFIYDGFTNNVYYINDNAVLAQFGNGTWFYVTENERTILSGISNLRFLDNGEVLYTSNQNYKTYITNLESIKESVSSLSNPLSFVSDAKYNGKLISYCYNEKDNVYVTQDKIFTSDYQREAQIGIFVTDYAVFVDNTKVAFDTFSSKVTDIIQESLMSNIVMYRVNFENGSTKYFIYTKTLLNY